jgi:hypothetical protein
VRYNNGILTAPKIARLRKLYRNFMFYLMRLTWIRLFYWPFLLMLTGCVGVGGVGYVALSGNNPVKAGETADIQVHLDKAPNFERGEIQVSVTGPDNSRATLTSKLKTSPGVSDYHISVSVPASVPGGTWTVSKVIFWTGAQEIPIASNIRFEVLANPNIVLPTSGQVTLILSQAQLLRAEAAKLRFRLEVLKSNLALHPRTLAAETVAETLRKNIDQELGFLAETEARFVALEPPPKQVDGAASVFFDDLRVRYEESKSQLKERAAKLEASSSFRWTLLAMRQGPAEQSRYPVLAQAVFRAFEQNEVAYVTVANAGALTFDLDVSSIPEGATISYRRRGDSYRQHPDQTNSVIRALPYAT